MSEELQKTVVLKDGRTIARKAAKVRDMANAEKQGKNAEHLTKYAILAAKLTIDGKQAVIEDILDTMTDEDLVQINALFVEDEKED